MVDAGLQGFHHFGKNGLSRHGRLIGGKELKGAWLRMKKMTSA
jgi:hypothetical protein